MIDRELQRKRGFQKQMHYFTDRENLIRRPVAGRTVAMANFQPKIQHPLPAVHESVALHALGDGDRRRYDKDSRRATPNTARNVTVMAVENLVSVLAPIFQHGVAGDCKISKLYIATGRAVGDTAFSEYDRACDLGIFADEFGIDHGAFDSAAVDVRVGDMRTIDHRSRDGAVNDLAGNDPRTPNRRVIADLAVTVDKRAVAGFGLSEQFAVAFGMAKIG